MIIQLADIQKWPGPPFDYHEYAPELVEIQRRFKELAPMLPEHLKTQLRWFMYIDRFTEGEVLPATGGAYNAKLSIRLNEVGRVFLAAFRADSGVGESISRFIHSNPVAENQQFNKDKFEQYERRTIRSNVELRGVPLTDAKRSPKA